MSDKKTPFLEWFLSEQECDSSYYDRFLSQIDASYLPAEPPKGEPKPLPTSSTGHKQYDIDPRLTEIEALAFAVNYGKVFSFYGGIPEMFAKKEWLSRNKSNALTKFPRDVDFIHYEMEFEGSDIARLYELGGYKTRYNVPYGVPWCVEKMICEERVDVDAALPSFAFHYLQNPRTIEELIDYSMRNREMKNVGGIAVPFVTKDLNLAMKLAYLTKAPNLIASGEMNEDSFLRRIRKDLLSALNTLRMTADETDFDMSKVEWLAGSEVVNNYSTSLKRYLKDYGQSIAPYLIDKDVSSYLI